MKQVQGERPFPQVVCGFPGVGKSSLFRSQRGNTILDSDSSTFDKSKFPANYLEHIKDRTAEGYTILASSHADVRKALQYAKIPFLLVYPALECKDEYLQRYRERGSPDAFVNLLDKNWGDWIGDCQQQTGCAHRVLQPGEFLSSMDNLEAGVTPESWK